MAHEALIREWPALREWLNENRENLLIQRRINIAAHTWLDSGRDSDLLYRGNQLRQIQIFASQHGTKLNKQEREFIEASQSAEAVRVQEKEAARKNQELVFIFKWTLATTFGSAFGFAVARGLASAVDFDVSNPVSVDLYYGVVGVAYGAIVGLPQWLIVLRGEVDKAGWWVLATALGLAVDFLVLSYADSVYPASVAIGGAVAGLITGYALVLLLRQRK